MKIYGILFLFFLGTIHGFSQPKTIKNYSKKNGFCSSSLTLYSDTTYLYEFGCEGQSHINFGKWKTVKGKTTLYPIDTASYIPIQEMMETHTETGDSSFIIKVIDRYNRPIQNFPLVVVSDYYDMAHRVPSQKQYIFKNLKTGDLEFLDANHTGEDGIVFSLIKMSFTILLPFPNDKVVIEYKNSRYNTVVIKMNVNKEAFLYPSPKWFELDFCEFEGQRFEFKR